MADSLVERDSVWSIAPVTVGIEKFTPLEEELLVLKSELEARLKKESRKRYGELMHSQVLEQLAGFAVRSWKGGNYEDRAKWNKLERRFKRAKRQSITGFNIVTCVSFRLHLTDNSRRKLYYDKEGEGDGFQLYYGKRPSKKQLEEGYEPMEVEAKTHEKLLEEILVLLRRRGVYSDIRKGIYSNIGVAIEFDANTIGKSSYPTARVVVFLGAKRLQRIRKPAQTRVDS